jgi:cyclophilin family peptidyl-prolyl cis-trans isomerase
MLLKVIQQVSPKKMMNYELRYSIFNHKYFLMYTFVILIVTIMKKILFIVLGFLLSNLSFISCQSNNSNGLTTVLITTDSGNIKLILYDETPLHKENFIKLINEKFYDGQHFHRLIKDFMIQGGDPNSKNANRGELLGQGGTGYTIPAEINPKYFHKKGALAAARNGDPVNPDKASSGSQFYIVQGRVFIMEELNQMVLEQIHAPFTDAEIEAYTKLGGTPHLDGRYTVFGEITEGFDVLDKLMNVPVDAYDRPLTDIEFSIKILE